MDRAIEELDLEDVILQGSRYSFFWKDI